MSADQVIALIASIGACFSAIAAFLTIRQVSKQREASYHPELVITRTKFECISNPLSEGNIPDTWVTRNENGEIQDLLGFFGVPIRNVGLGAAKEVNVTWSFKIEQLIKHVNEIAQKTLTPVYYHYKNGTLSLKTDGIGGATSMWQNQQKSKIDFVLPAPSDNPPTELIIPPAFILSASALVHFYTKEDILQIPQDIPKLSVDLTYSDIGGKQFNTKLIIETFITSVSGKGESFSGYLEAKSVA